VDSVIVVKQQFIADVNVGLCDEYEIPFFVHVYRNNDIQLLLVNNSQLFQFQFYTLHLHYASSV